MKEIVRFDFIFVNMKLPGSVFAPPRKGNRKFGQKPKCLATAAHLIACYKIKIIALIELSFVTN